MKFMRLFVMYDLPVVTQENRKIYQRFRKFLLNDGYDMLQFSIYCRIVNGEDAVDKHLKRLEANLPPERQFEAMKFLVGSPKRQEKKIDARQTLLF